MYDYDAVVIGAGLGGLSTAACLAKNGLKTLVCENTSWVGGCCSSYEQDGYQFDIGASVVELSWIIDELFKALGKKTSDYIDFIPVDPIYGFVTEDGKRFSYPVDKDATREVLAGFSREDAEAWDKFARLGSEIVTQAFGPIMTSPFMTLMDAVKLGAKNPKMLGYMRYVLMNFESTLCSFFKSDKVRASMSLQSYFVGLPPALCPGYIAFLAYSEHEGIFYPRGGMVQIPKAIEKVFKEFGGEMKFDARVKKVLMEGGRAAGVELADGTQIRSKVVVSNVNAKTLYLDMIGRENLPSWATRAMESYEVSVPAPMIMLGLDTKPDLDAHHTFCYTTLEEMNSIWFEDYLQKKLPDRGFMFISWPTHADPSLAPDGHHLPQPGHLRPLRAGSGRLGRHEGAVPGCPAGSSREEVRPRHPRQHQGREAQHPKGLREDVPAPRRRGLRAAERHHGQHLLPAPAAVQGGAGAVPVRRLHALRRRGAPTIGSGIAASTCILEDNQ